MANLWHELCRQELEAAKEGKDMYQEDWYVVVRSLSIKRQLLHACLAMSVSRADLASSVCDIEMMFICCLRLDACGISAIDAFDMSVFCVIS